MRTIAFRRSASAALAALLVGAGAVVAIAPAQADKIDDEFIELLDVEGVPYTSRMQIIRVAKEYCLARTRPNAKMGTMNNKLFEDMGWGVPELQDFARAANRAYC